MAIPRATHLQPKPQLFVWLALLGLALVPSLFAALQFDVFPGFDNNVREAHWFPITFEVKNDGPTIAGYIELSSTQLNHSHARRVPLELPTGTLKRITVPVFSGSRYANWKASLVTERGKVLAEQDIYSVGAGGMGTPLRQVNYETHLLGALSRTASGLPVFPKVKRNQPEMQPAVARLQPAVFPDNPIALDGLQTIYLNTERALELKQPQVQALIAWLQSGGHLIIGIEQIGDVSGTPWLRDLMPCQLTSVTQIKSEGAFQNWIKGKVATSEDAVPAPKPANSKSKKKPNTPTPALLTDLSGTNAVNDAAFEEATLDVFSASIRDGRVLASAQGTPLAVSADRGRGKITVLLFSTERQPFTTWNNRPWFWAMLTDLPPSLFQTSDYYGYGGSSADAVFGSMIESKQIRKLPLTFLLLLLVVYLLVIGPVDQIWLKRINRQMLTWITFPIYVVFFSLLIYFIGFKLRAGDLEYNELHLVDVLPTGQKTVLRGRTYASIYSPSNDRYPLEGEQFMAALRGEYMANWGNSEENSQASVIQHGNNFSADVFVPVWTSQLYVNDWVQPVNNAPVEISARYSGVWHVKINSQLDRPLTNARVCVGGRIHEIGDLAPHQSREVMLEDNRGTALRDFIMSHGSEFFTVVEQRRQTFGSSEHRNWNLPNATMAASFISQRNEDQSYRKFVTPGMLDLSGLADADHAILLAWDGGHSATSGMNRFKVQRTSQNTLWRLVVPVNSKS